MDLVGPRYIKGDGRFYSMNVMDLYSHRVFIESSRTKEDDNIAHGLLRCWKSMGLPDFLQIDNELSFRGSNRYPRSLGIVLRLCDKCQDIGYPDVSRHRLPLMPFFVS